MPTFEYKARNRGGGLVSGNMDAPSADIVGQQLSKMGHFPIFIKSTDDLQGAAREKKVDIFEKYQKVKAQDMVLFTRQMATLFNAGLPILSILIALEEQIETPKFRKVIAAVRSDIQGGLSLSEAMGKHPDVFSELYVSMIEAGEAGGVMDIILKRLADLMEKTVENDAKVKAATRYPKMVIMAMTLAITILMWKVVPVFVKMFSNAKIELPLATKILIAVNTAFFDYWHITLAVFILIYIAFRKYTADGKGRYNWHSLCLKFPVMGTLELKSSMAKFTRVFGTLQMGGVPILDILTVSAKVVENDVIAKVVNELKKSVQEGSGIAVPLKRSGLVPPLVIQMVAAGEESGALDEMLIKVADYYDEEVDRTVKNLSSLIEPILLVFMAGIVLFLALAIFLPMWDMTKMAK